MGWFYLMSLIIPTKMNNKKNRKTLKTIVTTFSAMLLLAMFFGVIVLVSGSKEMRIVGETVFFISFGISVVQIILGIILRCVKKRDKK